MTRDRKFLHMSLCYDCQKAAPLPNSSRCAYCLAVNRENKRKYNASSSRMSRFYDPDAARESRDGKFRLGGGRTKGQALAQRRRSILDKLQREAKEQARVNAKHEGKR